MSVLTKVFVILLVLLSLVETSGLIIFVNKIDPFQKQITDATNAASLARNRAYQAEQEAAATRGERDMVIAEASIRTASLRAFADASEAARKKAEASIAAAEAGKKKAEDDATTALAAANGALETNKSLQKVINDQAVSKSESEKKTAELQTQVANLTKQLDGTIAALRRKQEELTSVQDKLDLLTNTAPKQVMQKATDANGGSGSEAFVNLQGVIKAKRKIAEVEYATISIGSAQNVQKGMTFKVVDRGNFLGYLVVDSVETEESVGHLTGNNLGAIREGTQVRTQW